MKRSSAALALLALAALCASASAHFPFLLPAGNDKPARLIFSEDLTPDPDVDVSIAKDAKLFATANGTRRPLTMTPGEKFLALDVRAGDTTLYGTIDLGVSQRGNAPANHLIYYPKTLLKFELDHEIGKDQLPLEIVPVRGTAGLAIRLKILADGKPLPNAKVVVIHPEGRQEEFSTDADGLTANIGSRIAGPVGAWTRRWIDQKGTIDGKEFTQLRQYATIVFDKPPQTEISSDTFPAIDGPTTRVSSAGNMPEKTSSFGAVASDGWLYVYGGHISPVHEYSTAAVSGKFFRRPLSGGEWQTLEGGPGLQGMNLAAADGYVYRVGGMQPKNAPGTKADVRSTDAVARFDPSSRTWGDLPPLPAPRSSHDVAIIDGQLYVVGGWNLTGTMAGEWPAEMLRLNLRDPNATWRSMPQPFQRRALICAVHDHKLFVIGGFDENDEPSRRVDVFDPTTNQWSRAPGLPGAAINGFAPAAVVHDRNLYVSVGDGTLYRLNESDMVWDQVATATPRIVHRLVSDGPRLLILGGAAKGQNLDLIEAVTFDSEPAPAVAATTVTAPKPTTAPATRPTASAIQTHCPVMPDEEVDDNSFTVVYKGETVKLCCRRCIRQWNENPEKFANSPNLPQLAGK